MRHAAVLAHRVIGLAIAAFLLVAGLTGSVIVFRDELDRWLNPSMRVDATAGPLALSALVERLEAADPRVRLTYLYPPKRPGEAVWASVAPRLDPATGRPFQPGYNEVWLDPADGRILGRREAGALRFDRAHAVPFLVALHHNLHLPGDWGRWLLGVVSVLWILDGVVAGFLTLPRSQFPWRGAFWRKWRPAWGIKRAAGGHRLTLDLHRAGGLWLWSILALLAVTSVAMNLPGEVFRPVVAVFGTVSPPPVAAMPKRGGVTGPPTIGWTEAAQAARAVLPAGCADWPLRYMAYLPGPGVYRVGFAEPGFREGAFRVAREEVYVQGDSGGIAGRDGHVSGTAADRFLLWQFPLHSGRMFGWAGRVAVALAGLVVAVLSVTGTLIWWRKLRSRRGNAVGRGGQGRG